MEEIKKMSDLRLADNILTMNGVTIEQFFNSMLSAQLSNYLQVVDADWDSSKAEPGVFYFIKK